VTRHLLETRPGKPYPLGASVTLQGVQFTLVSKNATGVYLQLFHDSRDSEPFQEFELDPSLNRTGNVWHIEVTGLTAGALYLYRVDGPFEPKNGHRFNRYHSLLDPYARALTGDFTWDIQGAIAYEKIFREQLHTKRNRSTKISPSGREAVQERSQNVSS